MTSGFFPRFFLPIPIYSPRFQVKYISVSVEPQPFLKFFVRFGPTSPLPHMTVRRFGISHRLRTALSGPRTVRDNVLRQQPFVERRNTEKLGFR